MLSSVRNALLVMMLCITPAFAKSKLMEPAAEQAPKPEPGKALVVFMRPSMLGFAIASSVYHAPDGETRFLGVVGAKDKLAYQAEPGDHRFMVIAENADFMDAHLEAGKTYYVLISPRPGMWKARFSLIPVLNQPDAKYSVRSADFKEWMAKTEYVQLAPAAEAWFEKNKASVEEKKVDYLKKWNVMAPADRAELTLNFTDGVLAE